ncbi:MAG TPA: hypothetical protein VNA21_09010 [Steroidobacteraceae bacterium]|nr:hypothetical protein [Steroidobacteraceae bacterium]
MLIIKSRKRRVFGLDEPLKHESHKKPVTRRDFLAQGFLSGAATVIAPTMLASMLNPQRAAALAPDLNTIAVDPARCNIRPGTGRIPFICFDLAGGANIAGSNVLVGQAGGQLNLLSTQGYSKLGIPGDMLPNTATGDFIDQSMGIAFHSDSAWLRGILTKASPAAMALTNGIVIPARSENDTGNNPHNPMYGLAKAGPGGEGARGELLTLIGSQNSESGGNSMAPAMMLNAELRPTKIDRNSDVAGLGSTGPAPVLGLGPTVKAAESMARISGFKLGDPNDVAPNTTDDPVTTGLITGDLESKRRAQCAYIKSAKTMEDSLNDPSKFSPRTDPDIQAIFPGAEFGGEFEKTASVMKLVVPGAAGAGTISMGGYDYHTGDRMTGEARDFRAGQCIGAVLEYAHRRQRPVMLYIFSDGSLSSNGRVDDSVGGRGKGEWTGDNQQTACSVILVYNPTARPALMQPGRNQIGAFSKDGDVVTSSNPGANSVNLLVHMVLLNYMALNGEAGDFTSVFGNVLGASAAELDRWIGFQPLA